MSDGETSAVAVSDRNSIYEIAKRSPSFSWPEREAVTEDEIDAALGAGVPGGASVLCWLPMVDGHTVHQTARDVMRAAIAGLNKHRLTSTPQAASAEVRERKTIERVTPDDLIREIYKREGWTRHDKGSFNSCTARCAALYDITAAPQRNRYVATPKPAAATTGNADAEKRS